MENSGFDNIFTDIAELEELGFLHHHNFDEWLDNSTVLMDPDYKQFKLKFPIIKESNNVDLKINFMQDGYYILASSLKAFKPILNLLQVNILYFNLFIFFFIN